ncbi:hypothetical protein [Pedobacter sp. MC2016-24]|uniref:hypothetical protein n=1 Tax=Pedobacter sp. MC2016-24 TaxID=2780090 RepID=UPI0018804149|nr:hypothetical protein [Pedobacter sp. MC2016-24]MBE9599890.1 hypothetical protein [Pedobacter sp. MC2016-24]
MNQIRTLADELRSKITAPDTPKKGLAPKVKTTAKKTSKATDPLEAQILLDIRSYDTKGHKSMVHVRFDEPTVRLLNQFKMATEVDINKLVAFAVKSLFQANPELKNIIKHFIQNIEL